MKLLFTILIFLSLVSPALANDCEASSLCRQWDIIDKSLLTVLTLSHTADCLQTQYIFDDPHRSDRNPIIKAGVDRYGNGFIPTYFFVSTLCAALIADWLPSDYRKPWLGFWIGSSVTVVRRNFALGVKLHF